jgi:hypothetical protein
VSTIGDKIERIDENSVRGKTRQPSQNKSATRGKSSHIASRELIEPRTFNQISQTQMRKNTKNQNNVKQQDQVQMHAGDLSSSNFLNSERSSLNQKKVNNHLQATSGQQNTIQYTNGD